MTKTLKMPEKTVNDVRDKINCYNADMLDLGDEIRARECQIAIIKRHQMDLFRKLRDLTQK